MSDELVSRLEQELVLSTKTPQFQTHPEISAIDPT
jgi:hypothetical protein